YPSVTASFETATQLSQAKMEVTISVSDGTCFRVASHSVLAFSCLDESCAPKRWFSKVETEQVESCAFHCLESPWVASYEGCQYDAEGNPIPLSHYLIFGGDNIVEFVCQHEPVVTKLPNWEWKPQLRDSKQ
ncbi:MAG: hypothetical protein AAB288_14985, partial [Acidobacteriota bacterium]